MGNAKTLLLVNDQETQIFEFYILRENSVGTDHDVHNSLFQSFQRQFHLRRSSKSGHHVHANREILHSLDKCIVMLLGKDRSRNQVNHLFSFLDRFECSTDRNLCFSVANVTTDQTVHDLTAFHIFLDLFDRC